MSLIFVSHASQDRAAVEDLVGSIEDAGAKCWVSYRDIAARQTWATAISSAIQDCHLLILFVSSAANSSEEVLKEAELALRRKKPVIVALKDQNSEPENALAYHFSSKQWARPYDNKANFVSMVLDVVRNTVEPQAGQGEFRPDTAGNEEMIFSLSPERATYVSGWMESGRPSDALPAGYKLAGLRVDGLIKTNALEFTYASTTGSSDKALLKEFFSAALMARHGARLERAFPRSDQKSERQLHSARRRFEFAATFLESKKSAAIPTLVFKKVRTELATTLTGSWTDRRYVKL